MPSFDHNNHNRLFPICSLLVCGNESPCKTIHSYENVLKCENVLFFIFYANQTYFHMNGFAQSKQMYINSKMTYWSRFNFPLLFKFWSLSEVWITAKLKSGGATDGNHSITWPINRLYDYILTVFLYAAMLSRRTIWVSPTANVRCCLIINDSVRGLPVKNINNQ